MLREAKTLFFNHHSDFKVTPKQFMANGKRHSKETFKQFVVEFYKRLGIEGTISVEDSKAFTTEAKMIADVVLQEAEEENRSPSKDLSYLTKLEVEFNDDLRERAIPIKDAVLDNEYLLDKETRMILPNSIESFKALFSKKEYSLLYPEPALYKVVYSVHEVDKVGELIYPQGPVQVPQANLYIPPRWTFCDDKREELHPDHKKMIELRFMNQDSLERYYCVLYHMLTDRNKNICGLVHNREGTGKSTVIGKIPGHLVGMENTSYTDHNFMSSPHKDAMLNKRMVFLDEHKLNKGQVSIEKKFVEDMLYINPKGKPAMTVPNTISWFMASNNEEDIFTEPSNRRHYFLEDSGKHIIEEFGSEWVKEYNTKLYDPEFVANLGFWILNTFKTPKFAPDEVYKGPSFERIVRATCFKGYNVIIDELLSGEVVDHLQYSELNKAYNKREKTNNKGSYFPRPPNFADFFKHFRWHGKPVCTVEIEEDGDILLIPLED